jgi:streptomycin 6-kinase
VVTAGDGAVLKVVSPAPEARAGLAREVAVLAADGGRACARLLRHDPDLGAALIERLGRTLESTVADRDAQLTAVCAVLPSLWAVTPPPGLPTGADEARRLAGYVAAAWERLGRPCPAAVVVHAGAAAERRVAAFAAGRSVLVHGDAHVWNTLEDLAAPGGWRFIDPDGILAEPEYDLGISLREFSHDLLAGDPVALARDRADRLAALTRADVAAVWDWGVLLRAENGLVHLAQGHDDIAEPSLAVSAAWADGPHGAVHS